MRDLIERITFLKFSIFIFSRTIFKHLVRNKWLIKEFKSM